MQMRSRSISSYSDTVLTKAAAFLCKGTICIILIMCMANVAIIVGTDLGARAGTLRLAADIRNAAFYLILHQDMHGQDMHESVLASDLKYSSTTIIVTTFSYIVVALGLAATMIAGQIEKNSTHDSLYKEKVINYADYVLSSRKNIIMFCYVTLFVILFLPMTMIVYYQIIILHLPGVFGALISVCALLAFFGLMLAIPFWLRVAAICLNRAISKRRG